MKLRSASTSIPGKGNSVNGDAVWADPETGLFICCDGVSGHASANLASQTAIKTIFNVVRAEIGKVRSTADATQVLEKAFIEANNAILATSKAKDGDPKSRPATTATAVLLKNGWASIAHIGDSRAYLIRSNVVRLLTEDHSYGADMIRKGMWTLDQARKSPYGNTLTRALGAADYVQVDLLSVELSAGDVFFLSTDGIHDPLGDAKMRTAIQPLTKLDGAPAVQSVIAQSAAISTRDDASAVVVWVDELDQTERTISQDLTANRKMDILSGVHVFKYLSYAELLKVMEVSKKMEVPEGSVIIQQGATGTDMFVVLSGELSVRKDQTHIAKRGTGEVLGEMAMIDNSARFASVVASKPSALLRIQRDPLFALMQKEPRLAVKLLWAICSAQNDRLKETTQNLVEARAPDSPFHEGHTPFQIELDE
ncbi:MAG: cyclic nucleotide-binding domain-containing protein [Bdellovibrionales bacterium]|nr:cyclic nucleotide-binding domain-containing protein [Bdellovibrionales bacterium]